MRDIILSHTPFPAEERVEKYGKVTIKAARARTDNPGLRTDVGSRKLTYTQILIKGGNLGDHQNIPNS